MRNALTSLPGVEKDSVKVNKDQKLATFKVKDAAAFDVNDAVKKVEGIGSRYKATLAKKGTAVGANVKAGETKPAEGESKSAAEDPPKSEGDEKK